MGTELSAHGDGPAPVSRCGSASRHRRSAVASDRRVAPQSCTQQSARFVHMTVTRTQLVTETWGGEEDLAEISSVWLGCIQARCLLLSLHPNTSFISSVLCRSVKADRGDLIGFIPTYPSDKGPIQKLFFKRGRSI